jgi:hypothetical protein
MMLPRHKLLVDAARYVITSTRGILGDDCKHARMVVVGGVSVMRWTEEYRLTKVSKRILTVRLG